MVIDEQNTKNVINHIRNLAGDYKCYDERLTPEEALTLCKLLDELEKYQMADTLLEHLSAGERDKLYQALWIEHIKKDMEQQCVKIQKPLNHDAIQAAAELYVTWGEYNASKPYWDNIDHLIEQMYSKVENRIPEEEEMEL